MFSLPASKKFLPAFLLVFLANYLQAQYYLTGTIFADSVTAFPYVKIWLNSNKMFYRSGSTGDFGIPSTVKTDTLICWAEGYDTSVHAVYHGLHNLIFLKPSEGFKKADNERGRLSNLIPNLVNEEKPFYTNSGETYPVLVENRFVPTEKFPVTGFSPNSNKASYANIRRFIKNGMEVNPHAIRIEEIINYFSLTCVSNPPLDEVFSIETRLTDCPWNPSNKMLFVNALARSIDLSKVPPANLVFLIDNSGSMDMPNRMPLLKSAFGMLVRSLRDTDRVAIVTYGGMAGIHLHPTPGRFKDSILKAIDELEPGGATAGSQGIQLAYKLATTNPIPDGKNRVIIATDGDFNVGLTAEKELEELISGYRQTGVSLTCLGVGMGNLKDSKIETLARFGNGNYAYLDNEEEAEKVLVKELTENLYSVAGDVTVHIRLNPRYIRQYRLVGYENRKGALYNENSYMVGGEIGSGFAMNALFEVTLADTSQEFITRNYLEPIGELTFKFTDIDKPAEGQKELNNPITLNYIPLNETDKKIRFTLAAASFGAWLKKSDSYRQMKFESIKDLAVNAYDPANRQQTEFIKLLEETSEIYFKPVSTKPNKLHGKKRRNRNK